MSINVRVFASLSEQLGISETTVDAGRVKTVAEVWAAITDGSLSSHILVAVNHEYADPSHVVQSGDEVAFFPPVTGG